MIAWADIETTGLDEHVEHLLEVALIITDDQLEERACTSVVVKPLGARLDELNIPLVVREMHEKSGLLADVEKIGIERPEAEAHLLRWLQTEFKEVEGLRNIPMAGNTIAFDRRWLRRQMPELERTFLHVMIDVSSIGMLAQRWAPHIHTERPRQPRGVAHRALDDIRHSIKTLRYYRECGFVGVPA